MGKVASPLSAVAVAAQEERERAGSPLAGKSESSGTREKEKWSGEQKSTPTERLVEGVKPSTPTLVVVGEGIDDREKGWAGATQQLKSANVGLAERRRMLAQNANGHGNGPHANPHSHTMGEISVGLLVRETERGERGLREKELRDLQNRKSERVVVERVT